MSKNQKIAALVAAGIGGLTLIAAATVLVVIGGYFLFRAPSATPQVQPVVPMTTKLAQKKPETKTLSEPKTAEQQAVEHYGKRLWAYMEANQGQRPQRVGVSNLIEAYAGNGVSAAQSYTGKLLVTTGTVVSVDGSGVVHLRHVERNKIIFIEVRATFQKEDRKIVAGLQPGDQINFAGDCQGLTGAHVSLTNCMEFPQGFETLVDREIDRIRAQPRKS